MFRWYNFIPIFGWFVLDDAKIQTFYDDPNKALDATVSMSLFITYQVACCVTLFIVATTLFN